MAFAGDVAGVGNFHQVGDNLYRGAQPSTEGFRSLADMGINTVIDLRSDSKSERKLVEGAGMHYIAIPLNGYVAPSDADVTKLLAILNNPASGKVFIHCRRGADRTGTIVACYRISHDHWTNDKALQEAKDCKMSWTERDMISYVMKYKGATSVADSATPTTQQQAVGASQLR